MENAQVEREIPPLKNGSKKTWILIPVAVVIGLAVFSLIYTKSDFENPQEWTKEHSNISKNHFIKKAPDVSYNKEPEFVGEVEEMGRKPKNEMIDSPLERNSGSIVQGKQDIVRDNVAYEKSTYEERLPPNFDRNGIPSKQYLDALKLNSPLVSGGSGSSGNTGNGQSIDLASAYGGQYDQGGLFDENEEKILRSFTKSDRSSRARNPNEAFLDRVSSSNSSSSVAVRRGNLEYTVMEGKMIQIVLRTAIDSQLPGRVSGVVTRDVYGRKGNIPLIPRGSEVNGEYNSAVVRGQGRVFVAWNRLITPDGLDINIGSAGADNLGRSGYQGMVNTHFWNRFGTSILLSIVGAGTATAGVEGGDNFNSESTYRQAISDSFQVSSAHALQNNISINDSIQKDQGERVMIFVAKDLDFTVLKEG